MKLNGMDAATRTATAQGYANDAALLEYHLGSPQDPALVQTQRGGQSTNLAPPADRLYADKQGRNEDHIPVNVIDEALEKANRLLSGTDRRFEITFHEKTKEVMVRVIDSNTNQTIREIPPKKIVDIVVSLCEMAGIIFDKKG